MQGRGTETVEEANASLSSADDELGPKKADYPPEFEAIWRAYPHFQGRSSKKTTFGIWRRLKLARRKALPSAVARYARDGREPKADCGAPAMERWLGRELDLNWNGETTPTPSAPTFTGPADLRAAIVAAQDAEFAVGYLDICGWRNGPERVLIAPNSYTAGKLRKVIGDVLDSFGIGVIVEVKSGERTAP